MGGRGSSSMVAPTAPANNYSAELNAALGPQGALELDENNYANLDNAYLYANPNYDEGGWAYHENCQRCVAAVEMRMRGYDVEALPTFFGDIMPKSYKHEYMYPGHYGPEGSWTRLFENMEMTDVSARNSNKVVSNIENQMRAWGDGARAIIRVRWRGTKSGHVMNIVNIGGDIVLVDGQDHQFEVLGNILGRAMPSKTSLWRVDDKEPTDLMAKAVKRKS